MRTIGQIDSSVDRMTGMGTLTFACPRTGQEIRSGIETDGYSLQSARRVPILVHCPFCRHEHEFRVERGFIAKAA
jgi:hypothetical protein